jgi:soluble cytochrome b562
MNDLESTVWRLEDSLVHMTKERDMWKANHDNQVKLKSILMDRPDLKDRSASMQQLISKLDQAREAIKGIIQMKVLPFAEELTLEQVYKRTDFLYDKKTNNS